MKQVISAKLKLQTTTEQCAALRTTQLACSVARHVGATYKGLWTKAKQNAKDRQNGRTRKRYKGLDQPPKYVSPTVEYQYGKDYSFKKEQQVSVLTLSGRVIMAYSGYNKHVEWIQHGAEIGAAKLWYDKPRKQFYLLVSLSIETPDPTPEQHTHIIGVDVGIRYLAVTSHPHSLIGLEDLTHIRERTHRKKGKQATKKQRKANAAHSKWSFAQLHGMIAYKAVSHSSMAIKVDADYSSQACPRCGYTCPENRPDKGLLFDCQNCHYRLHADLIGARHVTMRTLLVRQDWARTGSLSVSPDGSDREAKAARLQRYAELRWSPDTSSCLPGMG
jgi:transposase